MMRCSVHRLVLKTAAAARFASGGAAIVHRSPRKSVLEALGETGDSFTDYFREKCERNADETAFVCGVSAAELKCSDVVSMTEFWKRELYHRHGIRHGDVVAVLSLSLCLSPNSIEYAASFQ
ncbi:hypothetical protein DIPPA_13349 [Diplonema papillatum]|nr:hypothetical protein DIPPA_13349 [Diplonema papillatum]